MSALPPDPIPAAEFFEQVVPRILAASEPSEGAESLDLVLGVVLLGDGGGEWRVSFERGQASIAAGARDDAVMTLVQRVEDWRGALWEGRGGWFGKRVGEVFGAGRLPAQGEADEARIAALTPVTLAQLRSLDGAVRIAVSDGPGASDGWSFDLRIGDGPVEGEPRVCVTVSSADLEALESGELDPFQALMGGRLEVEGDMTFLMQLQAIGMQAAAAGNRR